MQLMVLMQPAFIEADGPYSHYVHKSILDGVNYTDAWIDLPVDAALVFTYAGYSTTNVRVCALIIN